MQTMYIFFPFDSHISDLRADHRPVDSFYGSLTWRAPCASAPAASMLLAGTAEEEEERIVKVLCPRAESRRRPAFPQSGLMPFPGTVERRMLSASSRSFPRAESCRSRYSFVEMQVLEPKLPLDSICTIYSPRLPLHVIVTRPAVPNPSLFGDRGRRREGKNPPSYPHVPPTHRWRNLCTAPTPVMPLVLGWMPARRWHRPLAHRRLGDEIEDPEGTESPAAAHDP
ncbi:hypothetical protein DFH06DRAFT_211373 [Mycena polygramma]|nr:hypothetical protein DFH06DRAFT_211373 [Mycena polygramma]